MTNRAPEINGWGIILLIFGVLIFLMDGSTGMFIGLSLVILSFIKIWWDIIKNG